MLYDLKSQGRLEGQGLSTGAGRALDTKGFFTRRDKNAEVLYQSLPSGNLT
jgi:hypothetical protein